MSETTVRVDMNARGSWEVVVPGHHRKHVVCATLDDARQVGHRWAEHQHPCELIVRDAYHRVVLRELIDGEEH